MQASQTNAIELAAAVSPRPQLFISVGKDPTRDFPTFGFKFIRHIYALHGKEALVENVHLADEAHDFGLSKRCAVFAFFARHLGMKLLAEDSARIEIETPQQMEVFNRSHPLPSHALLGKDAIAKTFAQLPRGN